MRVGIDMRAMMLSATLLVLAVSVIAAGIYVLRVSPLARPEGVPPQARNLGNVVQPSYWHWCEQANGARHCETYSRRGGFPLYSGRYLPVAPEVITQIASLGHKLINGIPIYHEA